MIHKLLTPQVFASTLLLISGFFSHVFGQIAEHLPENINSEYEERQPILSHDGNTLYFWRRGTPGNMGGMQDNGDIWRSQRQPDGTWARATRLAAPLNTAGLNFVWQVSPNSDTLWMHTLPPNTVAAGMAYSVRQPNGEWQVPNKLFIKNYQFNGKYKDYFLSKERVLFLPNVTQQGFGGSDIYVAFPLNDSTWNTPVCLSANINTPLDEDAPCLSPDGQYLFFSSNGRAPASPTNTEIFYSHRLDSTFLHWSSPQPVGSPVNTSSYDFDFRLSPDGKYAYWGSEANSFGGNDLFRLRLDSCESVDIYPSGSFFMCEGDSLVLEAGFTLGNPLAFRWLRDGLPYSHSARRLTVRESGNYRVIRLKGTCIDTSAAVKITVLPRPTVEISMEYPIICPESGTLLTANVSNSSFLQWYFQEKPIYQANAITYLAKSAGVYSLHAKNGGCSQVSRSIFLKTIQKPSISLSPATISSQKSQWYPTTAAATADFTIGHYATDFPLQLDFPSHRPSQSNRGNMFIARYDSAQHPLWVFTFAVENIPPSAHCHAALDSAGNAFLCGKFELIANFGNGSVLRANVAEENYFLAKWNEQGDFQWATRIGVSPQSSPPLPSGEEIAVMPNGTTWVRAGKELFLFSAKGIEQARHLVRSPSLPLWLDIAPYGRDSVAVLGITEKQQLFIYLTHHSGTCIPIRQQHVGKNARASSYSLFSDATNSLVFMEGNAFRCYGIPPSQSQRTDTLFFDYRQPPMPLYAHSPTDFAVQWLRNGIAIPAATQQKYSPTEEGEYQVMIRVGECETRSAAVHVIRRRDSNSR